MYNFKFYLGKFLMESVFFFREQLDRPGVSALALQLGIEKRGGGVAWSSSKINNLVRERGASIAPNNINTCND